MNTIKTQAQITRISSRVDGGLGLGIVTPELTTTEKAEFMELHNQLVDLVITPLDFAPEDTVAIDAGLEGKSPSQRLRAVLYVLWSQKQTGDFEVYYRSQMEKLIEHFKNKLD